MTLYLVYIDRDIVNGNEDPFKYTWLTEASSEGEAVRIITSSLDDDQIDKYGARRIELIKDPSSRITDDSDI